MNILCILLHVIFSVCMIILYIFTFCRIRFINFNIVISLNINLEAIFFFINARSWSNLACTHIHYSVKWRIFCWRSHKDLPFNFALVAKYHHCLNFFIIDPMYHFFISVYSIQFISILWTKINNVYCYRIFFVFLL